MISLLNTLETHSLESVLNDKVLLKHLKIYCTSKCAEENITFIEEVLFCSHFPFLFPLALYFTSCSTPSMN